ncbi:uncharacterized protein [Notamacropus eugenii]|uniref:uncharacterized protein n=1 Tax=Notamacropus eugenii TaxID=9315 RepID=UPI003B67C072
MTVRFWTHEEASEPRLGVWVCTPGFVYVCMAEIGLLHTRGQGWEGRKGEERRREERRGEERRGEERRGEERRGEERRGGVSSIQRSCPAPPGDWEPRSPSSALPPPSRSAPSLQRSLALSLAPSPSLSPSSRLCLCSNTPLPPALRRNLSRAPFLLFSRAFLSLPSPWVCPSPFLLPSVPGPCPPSSLGEGAAPSSLPVLSFRPRRAAPAPASGRFLSPPCFTASPSLGAPSPRPGSGGTCWCPPFLAPLLLSRRSSPSPFPLLSSRFCFSAGSPPPLFLLPPTPSLHPRHHAPSPGRSPWLLTTPPPSARRKCGETPSSPRNGPRRPGP